MTHIINCHDQLRSNVGPVQTENSRIDFPDRALQRNTVFGIVANRTDLEFQCPVMHSGGLMPSDRSLWWRRELTIDAIALGVRL